MENQLTGLGTRRKEETINHSQQFSRYYRVIVNVRDTMGSTGHFPCEASSQTALAEDVLNPQESIEPRNPDFIAWLQENIKIT